MPVRRLLFARIDLSRRPYQRWAASGVALETPKNAESLDLVSTRTPLPNINELTRRWIVIDADGKVLGRLASMVARHLSGKNKPYFTPFFDTGDFVIIVNAEKVALTGIKLDSKLYRHHTGYPGGLKQVTAGRLRATRPEKLIEEAVKGMLPKTKLGRKMLKKLKVYAGPSHPHAAQTPVALPA